MYTYELRKKSIDCKIILFIVLDKIVIMLWHDSK